MKAHMALEQYRIDTRGDSWSQIKAGTGAITEELSTMQEWEMLGISSDYSGSDPLELMIAAEEGGLDHLIDEHY